MRAVRQAACLVAICILGVVLARCAPPTELDPDASVEPGPVVAWTDPAPGEKDVLLDKVVKVYMTDHVDGDSVRRARFSLKSGNLSYWLMAFYDPVRGRLVVWPSSQLREGAAWVFSLEEGLYGLDGAPVPAGDIITFHTGSEAGDNTPYEKVTFDGDVKGIFNKSCVSCHGGADPMAGVGLDSEVALVETLIHGDAEGWPGWERLVPAKPGSSYLLYKIIGDPRIAGQPMPRTLDPDVSPVELSQVEREKISDWIAQGAPFFDPNDSSK